MIRSATSLRGMHRDALAAIAADPNERAPRTFADIVLELVARHNEAIALRLLVTIVFCLGFYAATKV